MKKIPNKRKNILLIDDDKLLEKMTVDLLESLNYNVFTADARNSCIEILKQYNDNNENIHIAILDIYMPITSGIEYFELIHKFDSTIKIIFTSGHMISDEISKLIERNKGSIIFLEKPYSIKELSSTIKNMLF